MQILSSNYFRVTRRNPRNIEEEPRIVTFKEPEFVLLNESRPDNDSCSNSSTEDVKKPEDIKIVGNYWISPTRESEVRIFLFISYLFLMSN
jgi:hypothetical protein